MQHASGSFTVAMAALPAAGGFSLDKHYSGDLQAGSQGQMLSAGNPAAGEAGYVAMEHVQGTLAGRSGGFALMHSGTMTAGGQQLVISIVPGSGSGDLAGISGHMSIRIDGKAHYYTLDYALPAKP
ncbi:MAG: DUF3224 domain-containing protein [Sphingomonadales bacterium]